MIRRCRLCILERQHAKVDVLNMAKYIVSHCSKMQKPISNWTLQNLLYYIQLEYLRRGMIAFNNCFEVWRHGPTIPTIYYHFCNYGAMDIDQEYDIELEAKDSAIINGVIREKLNMSAWDIVEDVRRKDSVWTKACGAGLHEVTPSDLFEFM